MTFKKQKNTGVGNIVQVATLICVQCNDVAHFNFLLIRSTLGSVMLKLLIYHQRYPNYLRIMHRESTLLSKLYCRRFIIK